MQSFAYTITVNSEKKIGGAIHADSLENAMRLVIERNHRNLTLEIPENPYLDVAWKFRGQTAHVALWIPPEYYARSVNKAGGCVC